MSKDIKIQNNLGDFSLGQHSITFDSVGRIVMVSGQNKLIQDIEKIFTTNINLFYPNYKTNLDAQIGSNLGKEQLINIISQKITDSLVYLQYLQQQQAKYQKIQASEIIKNILGVTVNYLYELTNNQNDLTTYAVSVVIESAANQIVTVNRDVTRV